MSTRAPRNQAPTDSRTPHGKLVGKTGDKHGPTIYYSSFAFLVHGRVQRLLAFATGAIR
jgi:hypothetical protein